MPDGITVRNDTGVYEGGEISIYYDPMIAKLVTHAPTREQAIDAQADALDAFVIDGIRHNIPFLSALMAHPRWRAGKLSTGFIAEEFPDGFHPHAPDGERARVLASGRRGHRPRAGRAQAADFRPDGRAQGDAREPARGLAGRNRISARSEARERRHRGALPRQRQRQEQRRHLQSDWKPGDPLWTGTINSEPVAVQVRPVPNGFALAYRGVETKAYVYTESEAGYARLMPAKKVADTGKQVLCPMPGLVVSIAVKEGQEVKAGETVAVVEAMKMENVLRAEIDGTVKKINAKPGDSLAVDAVILEFA